MSITVRHSKTLVSPNSGSQDRVYGSDYVNPASHTVTLGANDNFVTNAEKIVIGNTSGTNTGNQDLSGLQPLDAQLTDIAANLTATAAELNYTDGVIGPIQVQLDDKDEQGSAVVAVAAHVAAADPHTQYALESALGTMSTQAASAVAITGGTAVLTSLQTPTINGGTAANDDITIQGTTHATRATSYVNLQPSGGFVGVGTPTPVSEFVVSNLGNNGLEVNVGFDPTQTYLMSYDRVAEEYTNFIIRGLSMIFAPSAVEAMRVDGARMTMAVPLRKKPYTVGTLPAAVAGDEAYVADALAPAFLIAVAGGGAAYTPVGYTGAAWVCG